MPRAVRKHRRQPRRAGLAFEELGSLRGATPDARELLLCASHDLSSPLAAIKWSAEEMERRWDKGEQISGTEWAAAMMRISKAADGAVRLMEDLLSVEQLAEGDEVRLSKKMPSAPVDVNDVIDEAISLQRDHLERARCEVTVRCEDGLTARGPWDRGSLLRIFSNLLQNGSRYGPGAPIRIGLSRREDRLCISFVDHGPGFTARRASTAEVPGAGATRRHGLGLWIVGRAVERLGGSLAVKSDPGSGTSFMIEVPGLSREAQRGSKSPDCRPARA